ncbi:MAG: type II toxin-antitoxin system VapC family toxin [Pseudomonadota bacterium]|nr:type II toxin-antitoxin system VapC family toxin [Pseudomonadota bacterium]
MILIDTNVISEIMKVEPSEAVVSWLNDQKSDALYVSAVTIGEIEYGLRVMPIGKRQLRLKERFERFVSLAFAQRVLAYDETAARAYGENMGLRKETGRPMNIPDGQIAAIARANTLTVATRNTRDFEDCGIELIDPFLHSS